MATRSNIPNLPDYPPELIRFVTEEAERDADRAWYFLRLVDLAPPPGQIRRLPAGLLLNLGAAARLLEWEQAGITIHLDAGLPCARDAARRIFLEAVPVDGEARGPEPWLSEAVFRLTIDRFAWTGRTDLQAEIRLDFPDEDVLVEALAQFLWTHRHAAPSADRGPAS
jgi:hypothetical protein